MDTFEGCELIMLVSIIMPVYNSFRYLAESIQSVLGQSYKNWQLIIVDDCSTDGSCELALEYAKNDSRIKVYKLDKNSGPAVARNFAIEKANGRFISFLDSDDLWKPEFLITSLDLMLEKNIEFCFASYHRCDENLNPLLSDFIVPEKVSYKDILKTNPISCLTAVYDTSRIGKLLMPNIIKRQDYGLWLKILKQTVFAYGIKKPLAIYRIRKQSVSRNKVKASIYQWRTYRDVEHISLVKSIYYFIHYAYYGFIKYRK